MRNSNIGYFRSLADELLSQSSRVRQLIGDSHWGHDGRHKEVLLQNLVRRHCPSTVLVSTGFVVSPNDSAIRSTEQDLLVIDVSAESPLFHQGDFVVVFPQTVIAAISIKTTMTDKTVKSVVDGLASVRETARYSNREPHSIWCGGFFYNTVKSWKSQPSKGYASLKRHILANPVRKPVVDKGYPHVLGPDAISEAHDTLYLIDYQLAAKEHTAKIRGYNCEGAATAVFLSCLLEHLALHFTRGHSAFSDVLSESAILPLIPPVFALSP